MTFFLQQHRQEMQTNTNTATKYKESKRKDMTEKRTK